MLVAHGDGHDEHHAEVRGVRGEIEVKEESVRERVACRCEQEQGPDDVDGGEHDGDRVAALTPVEECVGPMSHRENQVGHEEQQIPDRGQPDHHRQ